MPAPPRRGKGGPHGAGRGGAQRDSERSAVEMELEGSRDGFSVAGEEATKMNRVTM
jgi:hypothetical protein